MQTSRKVFLHSHYEFADEMRKIVNRWNRVQKRISFDLIDVPKSINSTLLSRSSIFAGKLQDIALEIKKSRDLSEDDVLILFTENLLFDQELVQSFFIGTNTECGVSLDKLREIFLQSGEKKENLFRAILLCIVNYLTQIESDTIEPHRNDSKNCILDFCNFMPQIVNVLNAGPKYCSDHIKQIKELNADYLIKIADTLKDKMVVSDATDSIVSIKVLSKDKARLYKQPMRDAQIIINCSQKNIDDAEKLRERLTTNGHSVIVQAYRKTDFDTRFGYEMFHDDHCITPSVLNIELVSKSYREDLLDQIVLDDNINESFKRELLFKRSLGIRLDDTDMEHLLDNHCYGYLDDPDLLIIINDLLGNVTE